MFMNYMTKYHRIWLQLLIVYLIITSICIWKLRPVNKTRSTAYGHGFELHLQHMKDLQSDVDANEHPDQLDQKLDDGSAVETRRCSMVENKKLIVYYPFASPVSQHKKDFLFAQQAAFQWQARGHLTSLLVFANDANRGTVYSLCSYQAFCSTVMWNSSLPTNDKNLIDAAIKHETNKTACVFIQDILILRGQDDGQLPPTYDYLSLDRVFIAKRNTVTCIEMPSVVARRHRCLIFVLKSF